jgi:MFS family permease
VSVATRAAAGENAGAEAQPHFRRNVLALGADFSTFMIGLAFAAPATLIPAFAERLGAPNLLIGAIPALMTAGWMLPAIFAANHTQSLARKLPFILKYTVFERISYPLLGLAAIFLAPTHPTLTLVLMILLLGVMTFSGGLLMPAWLDLVARAVPVTLRGRFFALSTSVGTGLGLGGAAGVAYLLDRFGYPVGYGLCFLAATVFFALSFAFLALAREPNSTARASPLPTAAYLRRLPRLVRADPNLARFLGARALDVTGGMASGFYAVYALKELGAPDSAVGGFTLVLMAAQTVGMLVFGFLADRRGHLIVLTVGALASAGASLAALGATSLAIIYVVFAFYGLSIGATNVSGMPIGLEFGPDDERPTYVAITNSSRAPFALLGPLIGGALADSAGYGAVFGLAAALALAGAAARSGPVIGDGSAITDQGKDQARDLVL